MGYKAPRRVYSLEFEGDEFDGLVIKVRPPTVGEALDNLDLSWLGDKTLSDEEMTARLTDLYALFASRLVSWNLEDDDDTAIPSTLDGLLSLERDFGIRVVKAWLETAPPAPLGANSPSTEQSVELSIPMDETSVSLAS